MKYGSYDLGFGIHISSSVEEHDPLIPNLFVAQNSVLKLNPPNNGLPEKEWDRQWEVTKKVAHHIVDQLNAGVKSEDDVKDPEFIIALYKQFEAN